ncbi:cyclic peptide export ABC transporter [Flavitalea sp. BT771]|uniref:cyclic peptide export ABC transporter n=1 Tax=Flavitalea sp. BT771 TaxID=3063329 RepID=UPI0026E42E9A|nr:cyclic peptide export ABC transporter [Flavitalea sp. BT771]MDO6434624.1 cyclic peptide export ABC transporter [Flavitalea sp. BT771]MDV6223524.1 cyclic peptide export ABC transporter [Flavitalea sp. BT771]
MNISKGNWNKYIYFSVLSILSALGNIGVLYTINLIIHDYVTRTQSGTRMYLFMFVGSVCSFVLCRWLVAIGIIRFTQHLLKQTRIEILKMILRSPLAVLERNKSRILSTLTNDTNNIVNASINVVDIITNILVVVICLIYMAVLSWKLLVCVVGLILFTLVIYYFCARKALRLFKLALEQNDIFIKYLNEVIRGFKEINIAPIKGAEISERHIHRSINASSVLNQKAQVSFLINRVIGQIAFYIFIGLILLLLGDLFSVDKANLVNIIFLLLYTWSPIETVVLLIPNLSQARASLRRINDLEDQVNGNTAAEEITFSGDFHRLELKDIAFTYIPEETDGQDKPFSVGPVDFQISKGQAIFISGGNGSGKTTFINILTGLLRQDEGEVFVNGLSIKQEHLKCYKLQFAPVFSDCHLFDEFYGLPEVDLEKANEYLKLFEIDGKVTVNRQGFSDINLSTGQRKRLALIYAMLEKKPVLILDEFAADQDPHFKRKFYKEIIGYIKQEGFTLIAITHDDNYYQYADKLYKMDSGRMFEIQQLSSLYEYTTS